MFRRLLTIAAACIALGAQAQTPEAGQMTRHYLGAGASFDVNIPSGSRGQWSTGSGVTAGVDYAYLFNQHFFGATGLKLYYRTMGINSDPARNDIYEATAKNIGLRIPFMVGYTTPVSENVAMSVATGPELDINLYARQGVMPDFNGGVAMSTGTVNMFKHGFKHVDAMWGITLGFTFADHYYVGVSGDVAFTPLASYGNGNKQIKVRGNSVAVKLCYIF
ncbi:MAG: PorT family protein [Muribaculaceae bacterium]|nr:PorT family protein [Muribaculaceae bacterium]